MHPASAEIDIKPNNNSHSGHTTMKKITLAFALFTAAALLATGFGVQELAYACDNTTGADC